MSRRLLYFGLIVGCGFFITLSIIALRKLAFRDVSDSGLHASHTQKISFDAGTVDQETVVRHTYVIENSGARPLKILKVQKSCTCTTAMVGDRIIPRGGKKKIDVSFNVERRSGKVSQQILLKTDNPELKLFVLELTCNVQPSFEFYPAIVNFGKVASENNAKKTITLWNGGNEDIEIVDVQSSSPEFKIASITPIPAAMRKARNEMSGKIILIGISQGLPCGKVEGTIVIKTNSNTRPEIHVPVIATVLGDLYARPARIHWGTIKEGESPETIINVYRYGQTKSTVATARSDSDRIKLKSLKLDSNNDPNIVARLQVTLNEKLANQIGINNTMLKIKTTSQLVPEIVIPVAWMLSSNQDYKKAM